MMLPTLSTEIISTWRRVTPRNLAGLPHDWIGTVIDLLGIEEMSVSDRLWLSLRMEAIPSVEILREFAEQTGCDGGDGEIWWRAYSSAAAEARVKSWTGLADYRNIRAAQVQRLVAALKEKQQAAEIAAMVNFTGISINGRYSETKGL